jgi:TolB protein
MMRHVVVPTIIALILSWNATGWGKVYIDINAPGFQKYPIAITDFKNLGTVEDKHALSAWFSYELSRHLNLTGFFNVIKEEAFLEDPIQAGITVDTIYFQDWSSIGADFLVKGGFTIDGNKLSVEFRLFDVVEGKLIVGRQYEGTAAQGKVMVLRFVDEILLALTGEKSVFDTKLAFVAKEGRVSEIYTVNFDGMSLTKETALGSLTMLPQWLPDGRQISFTSYVKGNPDAYVMNLATKQVKELVSFRGLNMASSWSPDGSKVLLVLSKDGNEEIYVKHVTGNILQRLTHDYSIDVSPTWSPDGTMIAFVSNRSGSPQVFTMNADGGGVSRLTYEGSYNTSPHWSPKGNRIAYEGMINGEFQIFSVDVDGKNCMQLTFGRGGGESPVWSPGGMYLAFVSVINGQKKVCIINSNGLNLRTLGSPGRSYALDSLSWSPRLNMY